MRTYQKQIFTQKLQKQKLISIDWVYWSFYCTTANFQRKWPPLASMTHSHNDGHEMPWCSLKQSPSYPTPSEWQTSECRHWHGECGQPCFRGRAVYSTVVQGFQIQIWRWPQFLWWEVWKQDLQSVLNFACCMSWSSVLLEDPVIVSERLGPILHGVLRDMTF